MKRRKASFNGLVSALRLLSDEEQLMLVDNPGELKEFARALIVKLEKNIFFTPVADHDVLGRFQETVIKWRKLAAELGYTGPVFWRVRAGFTLKHAPKAGPCNGVFEIFDEIRIKNDETTKNSFVFWAPHVIEESKNKTVEEQLVFLAEMRKKFFLPDYHLSSFGSATLLSGLILAHFKRTGERVPFNKGWVRTDTLDSGPLSKRWNLGDFDDEGLYSENWDINGPRMGCFPLGVELIN